MTWTRDLVGAGLLLTGIAVFVLTLEGWTRKVRPGPEWSRKILHFGGLIPCLLIPSRIVRGR